MFHGFTGSGIITRLRRASCPDVEAARASMAKRSIARWAGIAVLLVLPAAAMGSPASSGEGTDMGERMMLLVIQLGVILFAAKLGSILFEKLKLPGPLGELAAGVVIGPYALGQLGFYGFSQGVFSSPAGSASAISPELYGLSAVAAVVLLFNVGLETDLRLLMRYSVAGGLVGLGGLVVSFVFGAASLMFFSRLVLAEQVSIFAPQCLLLGTVAAATSVGIPARILSERRKLDSPEGVTILAAAVIDDVLGIILLAIVMSVVTASRATGAINWGHVGIVGARTVGVWPRPDGSASFSSGSASGRRSR